MVERTKVIDEFEVEVTPWGFLVMMQNKCRLLAVVSKVAPHVTEMIENASFSEEADIDIGSVIKIIGSVVEAFDEKELDWFIKTMLKQVHVNNLDMGDSENWDTVLTANSSLFYKIVLHVLEVNFGDFLEMLQTPLKSVAN